MKGNFSTDGLYESATKSRSATTPHSTSATPTPKSSRNKRPRASTRFSLPQRAGEASQLSQSNLQYSQEDNVLLNPSNPADRPRGPSLSISNGRADPNNRVGKRGRHIRAHSIGQEQALSLIRRVSQAGSPALGISAREAPFKLALWLKPPGTFTDPEPLRTLYDSGSDFSLVTKHFAAKLHLQILVYPPSMYVSIMTKFGMVDPEGFVKVDVEASWIRPGSLGECNITVVADEVLQPHGADLLAGKKIIERLQFMGGWPKDSPSSAALGLTGTPRPRTSPSLNEASASWLEANTNNNQLRTTSGHLTLVNGHTTQCTPSNSGLISYSSTNDGLPESTDFTSLCGSLALQSPLSENVTSQWSKEQPAQSVIDFNKKGRVETDYFDPQLNNTFSAGTSAVPLSMSGFPDHAATHGSSAMYGAAMHAPSPPVSQFDSDCLDPFFLAQGNTFGEGRSAAFESQGQLQPFQISQDMASGSATQNNHISEDSSAIEQGMTPWNIMSCYADPQGQLSFREGSSSVSVPEIRFNDGSQDDEESLFHHQAN